MPLMLRVGLLSMLCAVCLAFSPAGVSANQEGADMQKLALFDEDLNNLRYSRQSTEKQIGLAIDLYLKHFSVKDSELTRELAFIAFNKQYNIIRQKIESEGYDNNFLGVSVKGDTEEAYDKAFAERQKIANANGFTLDTDGEGGYRALPNVEYLVKGFGDAMPPSFREFFDFLAKANSTAKDAAIVVTADTLGNIILQGADIIKKYPNAYVTALVKKDVARLLYIYLNGTDNSLLFHSKNGKYVLREGYSDSYKKFLQADKSTYGYAVVEHVYNFLKKYDFSLTQEQYSTHGEYVYPTLQKMGL